jgi:hypothetical protein
MEGVKQNGRVNESGKGGKSERMRKIEEEGGRVI